MESPNPPSNAPDDWLLWLTEHVLTPLEGSFSPQLRGGVLSQGQIDFLSNLLYPWPRPQIVATMEYVLRDCTRFPTAADFWRLRPQGTEDLPDGCPVADVGDPRLASGAPWWWRRAINAIRLRGLERIAAYNALIDEAKRRGEPEYDWVESKAHAYTRADGQRVQVFIVTNCGWGRWKLDDRGRLISGHCYRPDREVIVGGSNEHR